MTETSEPRLRRTDGSDFWDRLCREADTDAVIAQWGVRPMWSASNPNDIAPSQQETDQQ